MNAPTLSSKVISLPRSPIREVMALAKGLENVIHFEVGEPLESTDPAIINAVFDAVRAGATKYVANAGDLVLRQLIAERMQKRLGRSVASERVVVTTGAVGALYTALMASLEPGSELLVPDPGWPNYYSMAILAGARSIPYQLRPELGFQPDLDDLAALVTSSTRAILVNSPGNPTGAVFDKATVQGIVELARKHGLFIISDEIYEDMTFDSEHISFGSFELDDRTWIVSGASKSFAMTGWRIGWLLTPEHAVQAAVALQEPIVSCIAAPSQAAAIAALKSNSSVPSKLQRIYKARRDILISELGNSGLLAAVPQGGYYALLDISRSGLPSVEVAATLVREHRVALVPGKAFGPSSDKYLRLAFTTSDDDLREGCRRILDWAKS